MKYCEWCTFWWSFNFLTESCPRGLWHGLLTSLSSRVWIYSMWGSKVIRADLEYSLAFLRRLNDNWQNYFPVELLTGVIERESNLHLLSVWFTIESPGWKAAGENTALVLYSSQLKFFSKVLLTAALLSNNTLVYILKNW